MSSAMLAPRWRRAAGSTNVVTQRSTCGTIGQRRSAAGLNATRPPFAAAISNGREAPHTLGPPSAERPRSQAVSRTVPEVRQACSSSTRQGSCLATKSGPVLHPQEQQRADARHHLDAERDANRHGKEANPVNANDP